MGFDSYVEVGRVATINFGTDSGKLVVIVDILDSARALIDGPTSGVRRQIVSIRRLNLTKWTVAIAKSISSKDLLAALTTAEVAKKFAASAAGQKLAAKAARAAMNDFDRFKLTQARKQRSYAVRKEFLKLKKAAK
eukprot:TRINITY_DN106_c0_g1_i5.p1 TRINITY_DN106_c0_g1~~TRINITY_DN106_c0_g1_i5.p1  ORF type:complete len:136 (+),score=83.71 TRINITY_DN106_c0_g1_i5:71-478(+)